MTDNPSAPVCYRHPHRETHVRCARCERPICPDCMNQASVGWQCPECVRAGQKSMRQARTALGGVGGNRGLVTKTLVGVNVAVFVAGLLVAGSAGMGGLLGGGSTPLHLLGSLWAPPFSQPSVPELFGLDLTGVAAGAYYRFFTAMFLHYGVLHLLFNMYVLWIIGQYLERELGPVRFVTLYLVSGLGGNVLTYLVADIGKDVNDPGTWTMSAGASGCIFGLFGALVLINRKLGRDLSGVYVILGLNLVITFLPGTNISWTGHVGGLVTGLLLGAALAYAPRDKRTVVQTAAFAATLFVFVALIVWHTGQLLALVPSSA